MAKKKTVSISIKEFDTWLVTEGITSREIANYFHVSVSAISRWRERNTIPKKKAPILQALCGLPRRSLLRHLERRGPELF
jgi:DNA-binding transcriptional regulator YiaG